MGAVLPFPGHGPLFGGAAFTENALMLARDAIRLPDVPEAIFWGAVITLAESPVEADRAQALQIWTGYVNGFQPESELPAPAPAPIRALLPRWLLALMIATPLVAGLFGRAVAEAVRAGGMGGW